jgi:hypothetical protein
MTAIFESSEDSYSLGPNGTYRATFFSNALPGVIWAGENQGDIGLTNDQENLSPRIPQFSTTFVDNLARAAFYKKLHQVGRQFQGYVFLGELRETLHLLRHPTQTLHNLCSDFLGTLRKRKRANPRGWLNGLGSLWLEQSFGWNPLMADIRDAISAYDRFTQPSQTVRISAGSRKTYDCGQDPDPWKVGVSRPVCGGLNWLKKLSNRSETHVVRYKGALRARVECPRWGDYSLFGFNPQEFIPAAWELLPWSFLVDYFTNIGDILDATITSERDVTYVNKSIITYMTDYRVWEMNAKASALGLGATWQVATSTGGSVTSLLKRKEVTRTVDVGLSMPTLQFNFALNDGQLANVAALLSQAIDLHPQDKPRKWHR